MTFHVRVVAIASDGQEQTHEIASLQRTPLQPGTVGLTLAEGKATLHEIQRTIVEHQTAMYTAEHRCCSNCGQELRRNGSHNFPLGTVFGQLTVASPRFPHCDCQPRGVKSLSPLAHAVPERTTPEPLFLETKWSSLMSFGLTAELLQEVLPMNSPLHASTIREHTCQVAQRLER